MDGHRHNTAEGLRAQPIASSGVASGHVEPKDDTPPTRTLYARPVGDAAKAAFPADTRPNAPYGQVFFEVPVGTETTFDWTEVYPGVEVREADCGLGCRCAAEVRVTGVGVTS